MSVDSFMGPISRRDWLKLIGLATAGTITTPPLVAQPLTAAAGPNAGGAPVRLSLNENPFGPASSVIAAIQREFGQLCRYTDMGAGQLQNAISAKEGLSVDHIVLGEILEPLGTHLSLQGGPGGEFIYSDPGYTALIDAASAVGGIGIPVPLNPAMQNDLPAIGAKVSPRTRAIFLVNPHNPTGTVTEADELRRFVRETSSKALVIVDEAYLEFADAFTRRTLADRVRAGDNVIVFRTFAKIYGLAGLDIGYGLVPRPIAQTLRQQGLDNPHLFNRLAVAAATASLADAEFVSRVAATVAHEREIWLELLHDLQVKVTDSRGNFVFFETGLPHAAFAASLLDAGIDIGRAFPPYDRWARISIGLPEENALARAAVRQVLGRSGIKHRASDAR